MTAKISILLILLFGFIPFSAFSQEKAVNALLLYLSNDNFKLTGKKSVVEEYNSIQFNLPFNVPFFANKIIEEDIQKTRQNRILIGGTVTYTLNPTCAKNLV